MNKKIMPILIFLSMVMSSAQCVTEINNNWKQKIKDMVSVVCAKIPSKKRCLIIASAITSVAVTVGILWKYTNVFGLICNKTSGDNIEKNYTLDIFKIPDNNNQIKEDNQNKNSDNSDTQQLVNKEDKIKEDNQKIDKTNEEKEDKSMLEQAQDYFLEKFGNKEPMSEEEYKEMISRIA